MAAITSTPAKSNPRLNELHVPAGETLFRLGERADSVFVITRGEMGIFASDGATREDGMIGNCPPANEDFALTIS